MWNILKFKYFELLGVAKKSRNLTGNKYLVIAKIDKQITIIIVNHSLDRVSRNMNAKLREYYIL